MFNRIMGLKDFEVAVFSAARGLMLIPGICCMTLE